MAGTGALGYRVHETAALDPGHGAAFDPWQRWREEPGPLGAVAAALLAANPHNTQPWQFAVRDTEVDLYADPDRTTGSLDPYLREQHVGLGCALENLVLACRARGLQPDVTLLPNETDPTWVAHVVLNTSVPRDDVLHEAIPSRHTDRGPFGPGTLSAAELADLVDATDLPGVQVQWLDSPQDVATLGEVLVDAATALVADDDQSRDGFVWFRGTDAEVQRYADGLTLDAQGLSPLMLTAAKLLPPSTRAAGDTFWLDQTRDVHTATAAAYGVITVPDVDDRGAQLVAGRLLQRVHLTATDRGVSLQHMNQITERIDRARVTGARDTFAPRLAALLPPGGRPLVAFRVGLPTRETRSSPRRPLAAVVR
ncbi:Acg family FMN-binding oxidoreductase [Jannaschia sp. R86511]|uniref:Acg family FMN-binding oxidoreductase n=1 Tax=Jannaschia sp. R86511 TaxID=3093853 RepID=UPI0036D284E9